MSSPQFKACDHQVGGHMKNDKNPDSLVDDKGCFYKPYQVGDRNIREAAFYALVWDQALPAADGSTDTPKVEGSDAAIPSAATWGHGPAFLGQEGTARPEDIAALRPFVPKYFGGAVVDGRQYLVMEDVCAKYRKPCVLDLKMGYRTWYEWGGEAYRQKCEPKDANTTQGKIGAKMSGIQVYRRSTGVTDKSDRMLGRGLTPDGVREQLIKFAGDFDPQALWVTSPQGIMPQLKAIREFFNTQRSFLFFQASLLFVYEGDADSVETANVQVRWIDFAHTFPSKGAHDTNVLSAVDTLLAMLPELK